jgi:hypothetical protein
LLKAAGEEQVADTTISPQTSSTSDISSTRRQVE